MLVQSVEKELVLGLCLGSYRMWLMIVREGERKLVTDNDFVGAASVKERKWTLYWVYGNMKILR